MESIRTRAGGGISSGAHLSNAIPWPASTMASRTAFAVLPKDRTVPIRAAHHSVTQSANCRPATVSVSILKKRISGAGFPVYLLHDPQSAEGLEPGIDKLSASLVHSGALVPFR